MGSRTRNFANNVNANGRPISVDVEEYNDNVVRSNIALLGFKSASNGSLAKFDLQDQIVDEFIDNSGVDTGASTNANVGSGVVSSGAPGNYFGDGSDGDVTISGNTTLTVQNTNGSYDGDMVFKQYNTLTINAGQTLSTNVPCRGLFIYVRGNCTINGVIDMTARGAYADPGSTSSPAWGSAGSDGNTLGSSGLQLGLVKSGSSETYTNNGTGFNGCGTAVRNGVINQSDIVANGKIYSIARYGATGGSGDHSSSGDSGNAGSSGAGSNQTGGGASGGGACIVAAVTDSSSITVQANGGTGTTGGSGDTRPGGNGGAGYVIKEGGIAGLSTFSATATVISSTTTAQAVPTKSDLILLMKNAQGTATLNTDIKAFISRDGGTTYTQGTLAEEGNYGDGKILSIHDLDISSQPSGTSMKYKIELANQASGSKETQIQGCSLGWK